MNKHTTPVFTSEELSRKVAPMRDTYSPRRESRHLSREERNMVWARVDAGESPIDVAADMHITETGVMAIVTGGYERRKPRVYVAAMIKILPDGNATAPRVRCGRFACNLTVHACVAQYRQHERCRGCQQGKERTDSQRWQVEQSGLVQRPENDVGEREAGAA